MAQRFPKAETMREQMRKAGPYSWTLPYCCLREAGYKGLLPRKKGNECLHEYSETYRAAIAPVPVPIWKQYDQRRAVAASVTYREAPLKSPTLYILPLEIMVDRESGIFRVQNEDRDGSNHDVRFGYVVDLKSCLTFQKANEKPQSFRGRGAAVVGGNPHTAEIDGDAKLLDEIAAAKASLEELTETERKTVILARLGQGKFRDSLINRWGGKCAITKCDHLPLLRASHIKPWAKSNNSERLNPDNGLLLIPNLDVAFDRGFISFKDDGGILISKDPSKQLSEDDAKHFGIHSGLELSKLPSAEMRAFLRAHRKKHRFDPSN